MLHESTNNGSNYCIHVILMAPLPVATDGLACSSDKQNPINCRWL